MKRRDFLSKAALGTLALTAFPSALPDLLAAAPDVPAVTKGDGRMHMSWQPYQLALRHTFTVSSFS